MASKNWKLFTNWAAEQPCTFFLPFLNENGDDFNFRALGRAAQMPETGIRQNAECRAYLSRIHAELVAAGHIAPKCGDDTQEEADVALEKRKKGELTNPERTEFERLKEEVIRLNEELRDAKAALKRYGKMEVYLAEFGVLPR